MIECPVCGRANLGGVLCCESCGAKLEQKDEHFENVLQNPNLIRFPHPPSTVTSSHPAIKTQVEMIGRLALNDEHQFILDDKNEYLIGRADKLAGIVPEIDLTNFDKEMVTSRRHACVTKKGDSYIIEDLGSTNFTYLNGRMLSPKTPTKLDDGDVIRIGKIYLVFSRIKKN
ncbi:MAG TPA: FHA domain-containing protein [Caldisericia bacterium]|nr:MAG: Oxoglutarate dehydrogenase inhibitor [bacterium ADurb.Bin132]HNW31694.1 FHA domain-containing protein [Caldisericia bacterium]HNY62030.1 FHA domain-containing protein [Caldisericia bacterium]HOG71050.1 FHA domain-containing protein [Caldisericia bacterium]HPA66352.1 FHA domain-containing protein [Caldisericia bacterium]